jgi:hypothetical protein
MARDGAKYAAQIASDCAGGGVNGDGNQTGYEGIFDRGRPVFEPDKSDKVAGGFHRHKSHSDDASTSDESKVTGETHARDLIGAFTFRRANGGSGFAGAWRLRRLFPAALERPHDD